MQVTIDLDIQQFEAPEYITAYTTKTKNQAISTTVLDEDTLEWLCAKFRISVFAMAMKHVGITGHVIPKHKEMTEFLKGLALKCKVKTTKKNKTTLKPTKNTTKKVFDNWESKLKNQKRAERKVNSLNKRKVIKK